MRSCARRYVLHRWGKILRLVNMSQVNENLNNPPAPGSARAGGGSGAGLPGGLPAGISLAFFWPVCLFNLPFFSHLHNSFAYSWPPPGVAIWGIGKKLSLIPDFTNNKILYSLNLPRLSPWSPNPFPHGLNNLGDSELQNLLNNMSQQQLMQVLLNEPLSNMLFCHHLFSISCLEAHWEVAMPLVLPACWVEQGGREWDRSAASIDNRALSILLGFLALLAF